MHLRLTQLQSVRGIVWNSHEKKYSANCHVCRSALSFREESLHHSSFPGEEGGGKGRKSGEHVHAKQLPRRAWKSRVSDDYVRRTRPRNVAPRRRRPLHATVPPSRDQTWQRRGEDTRFRNSVIKTRERVTVSVSPLRLPILALPRYAGTPRPRDSSASPSAWAFRLACPFLPASWRPRRS